MFDREKFKKRMRVARINKDMSVIEVANKVGVLPLSVYNYESGKQIPRTEILYKICTVLDVSADWLISRTDEM